MRRNEIGKGGRFQHRSSFQFGTCRAKNRSHRETTANNATRSGNRTPVMSCPLSRGVFPTANSFIENIEKFGSIIHRTHRRRRTSIHVLAAYQIVAAWGAHGRQHLLADPDTDSLWRLSAHLGEFGDRHQVVEPSARRGLPHGGPSSASSTGARSDARTSSRAAARASRRASWRRAAAPPPILSNSFSRLSGRCGFDMAETLRFGREAKGRLEAPSNYRNHCGDSVVHGDSHFRMPR